MRGHNASEHRPPPPISADHSIRLEGTKEVKFAVPRGSNTHLEVVSGKDVVWQMNRENFPPQEVVSRNGSIDLNFELRSSSLQIAKLIVREEDDKLSRLAGIPYFKIAK